MLKWVHKQLLVTTDVLLHLFFSLFFLNRPITDQQDIHLMSHFIRFVYVLIMSSQSIAQCIMVPAIIHCVNEKQVSNSLDIHFFSDDIHGWLFKDVIFSI